ncbi:MAG: NAD-binding protein [Bacteroidales bacterium]|nr:NAD-binding protein [Bacteroidales bacterium]
MESKRNKRAEKFKLLPHRQGTLIAAITILMIISGGTIGYMAIEDYGFLDALYMTIITVSTVGFGEVAKLSPSGRWFTLLLIISGLGTFAYAITIVTSYFVELQTNFLISGNTRRNKRKKMKDHVIVCGFGRNGRQTASELAAHNHKFVIVDSNHDLMMAYADKEFRFVEGDATEDDVLISAGVETAKAIITCLPTDADNLFIALTARALNPGLRIISRASSESAEKKLRMAGVDNIVLPEKVGGAHMAKLVTRADIVEFLEHLSISGDDPTSLIELECHEMHEGWMQKSIYEVGIRKKTGANIIGIKKATGELRINPLPDTKLVPNSKLFVLGTVEQIDSMRTILSKSPND